MKSNLNAVYGAIQQVDKLIKLDKGSIKEKEKEPEEKELLMEEKKNKRKGK